MTTFLPFVKMWDRIEITRSDSDVAFFHELMYMGELMTKIVTLGLVAGIADDRDRHRYRELHRLARADGLGDWVEVINDTLTGTAAQTLYKSTHESQRDLTMRVGKGTWQFDSVTLLEKCLKEVDVAFDDQTAKVDGRKWFARFVLLRNKTRGHGAPPSGVLATIGPWLEESIRLVEKNSQLTRRPWAYLRRSLSGKYRVTKWNDNGAEFDPLKTTVGRQKSLSDGVYVFFDDFTKVELLESDIDALDFFVPNGGFNDRKFEMISYLTGNKLEGDASLYLAPTTPLPQSETQGAGILELQGKSFGNLPPVMKGYIHRQVLESTLKDMLLDDRHPVITLIGRGGIGKTSLALSVLHDVANNGRFSAILWFSARDIDLLPQGPKLVAPQVLSTPDIANELVRLLDPKDTIEKEFKPINYLAEELGNGSLGAQLYVFDNFETVRNPIELFSWIDTYIRLPNKILITTRFRDFKADYPVEVSGMTEQESEALIDLASSELEIKHLLTRAYRHELYDESDGHPYVIKILFGEVAKAGRLVKVERIVAVNEDILNAMFERTYNGLSPAAKLIFLILSNWRSAVPQIAVEAVLITPSHDRMDIGSAIDELRRSSFIDVVRSQSDKQSFLTTPLAASVFGKKKLAVSPMKGTVEMDTQLLQAFGAAQQSEIKQGIAPRVEKLFRYIANQTSSGKATIAEYLPMLQFIAGKYPPAWLLLASLYEESGTPNDLECAIDALRHYLETPHSTEESQLVWKRLASLCRRRLDVSGELNALVELCRVPGVPFEKLSDAANRVNAIFSREESEIDPELKQYVCRPLVELMEARISEGDANDYSRVAWLCMRLHEESRAKNLIKLGLSLDPYNTHLRNLASKLQLDI